MYNVAQLLLGAELVKGLLIPKLCQKLYLGAQHLISNSVNL